MGLEGRAARRCRRYLNAVMIRLRLPKTARLAASRVGKAVRWTSSVLSEPKKLSMGALTLL
jgi:hypothetical protein